MILRAPWLAVTALLFACGQAADSGNAGAAPPGGQNGGVSPAPPAQAYSVTEAARFDEPWAMSFLDEGALALVTEKSGRLIVIDTVDGTKTEVTGVPPVDHGGQGGLGDIVLAPDPDPTDKIHPVYLSWVEAGENDTRGAVVGRGDLVINPMAEQRASLTNLRIIWRQVPKVTGRGHFSHRIAVAPDGRHIFVSSGDRQKFDPAQDMTGNLGKIVRLNPDGSIPADNPFADQGGIAAQIWSLGHRNVLGLAFDSEGRLWASEMGPEGGDEVNLILRGGNYGWPKASNGSHYGGAPIPDHNETDGFVAPKAWWTPSVSPAGMAFYSATAFPGWRNSLLIGALSGQALIRLTVTGEHATEADRWPMKRIREVEVGPDGAVWLLEDGTDARLLKLTPAAR